MNNQLYDLVSGLCENGWTNITVSTLRHYLLICENQGITNKEIQAVTGYTNTPLKNHLDNLKKLGLIRKEVENGSKNGVPYRLNRYYPVSLEN